MLLLTRKTHKTPLKLLLTTEAFSSLTNQFMQILLPWYILSTTGSVLWTGFVGFCALLPNIFSSLFGASVIDKLGRSTTMLSCEVIQLALLGMIPVLMATGHDWPWLIGMIIFLSSFFDAPGQLARTALSPTFSRYADVPLSKTSGIIEAFDGIMSVVGPLLGGAVIALYGLLAAWIICVGFCMLIVTLCILVFSNRRPRQLHPTASYREVREHLKSDSILWKSILFTIPTFILGQSWELILLPTYIYERGFNSVYLGFLGAAFGLGAFAGALCFAGLSKKFTFFNLLTFNYAGYLLSVLILYFHLPASIVLAATALCGIPFGAFGAMIISIILLRTPRAYRSKMLGLYATATYTVESICVLGLAVLIQWAGLQTTLLSVMIAFVILIIISIAARRTTDFWTALSSENKKYLQNRTDLIQ